MQKRLYVSRSASGDVLHFSITRTSRTKTGRKRTTTECVSIVGNESRLVRDVVNGATCGTAQAQSVSLNIEYGDNDE